MKKQHAILLTAYNDFENLLSLLRFYAPHFDCYVHIDKKSTVPEAFFEGVKSLENVYVYQSYVINWGSYHHILAVLAMLKDAAPRGYRWYHIMSANTFPIKTPQEIADFFAQRDDTCFVEVLPAENDPEAIRRQSSYFFWHLYDVKSPEGSRTEWRLQRLQRRLRIRRKPRFRQRGYFYCHLPNGFVSFLLQYLSKHPGYLRRLSTMAVPEEFFFQNVLEASPYWERNENNCLIYSRWRDGDSGPAMLGMEDLDTIPADNALFIRKVTDPAVVRELLRRLS